MRGIYLIETVINGKFYIGSSVDINRRFNTHRRQLAYGNHPNKHLQSAWNKYGSDAFSFSVLELVAEDVELWSVEERWILTMNACVDGYNIQDKPLPNWNKGRKFSEETLRKMSISSSRPYSAERHARCQERMKTYAGTESAKRPKAGVMAKERVLVSKGMVLAFTPDGIPMMSFLTINEAYKEGYVGVRKVIDTDNTCGGFTWRHIKSN